MSRAALQCRSAPACVLVAEDDFELRRLLALGLRKDGHDVVEIASGSELVHRLGVNLHETEQLERQTVWETEETRGGCAAIGAAWGRAARAAALGERLERRAVKRIGGLGALDLIVMDIRMPGWSGLEVLDALRAIGCQVPVIVMTAFGDEETHRTALRLGAATVLDKPLDPNDLRRIVSLTLAATLYSRHPSRMPP